MKKIFQNKKKLSCKIFENSNNYNLCPWKIEATKIKASHFIQMLFIENKNWSSVQANSFKLVNLFCLLCISQIEWVH